MKNFVTNFYNYNDIVWGDVEKTFMRIILVIIKNLFNLNFMCHLK